jgi:hypothetical protein
MVSSICVRTILAHRRSSRELGGESNGQTSYFVHDNLQITEKGYIFSILLSLLMKYRAISMIRMLKRHYSDRRISQGQNVKSSRSKHC